MQHLHHHLSIHQHEPQQRLHRPLLNNPWIPIFILIFTAFIIGLSNTVNQEWLTGWDNLHPEFSFGINIQRSLFAVWQEYQSLGLLGGMGHAAALPRELTLWIISLFVSASYIRYIWTFAMLGLGGIGVFLFVRDAIGTIYAKNSKHNHLISLLAGVLYMVFPATQQMFAVPFEAFVTHFAALPILLWTAYRVFKYPSKKTSIFFIVGNILLATQAYIPTLFVTYSLMLGLMLISLLLINRSWNSLRSCLFILVTTFLLNAYWTLPFAYFTATRSNININSKINQMATEDIFLRNKAFGSIQNVINGQSFWIDTYDFMPKESITTSVVPYWQKNETSTLLFIASYTIFGIILIGCASILFEKKKNQIYLLPLFLLCLTMLATNTLPFSLIGSFIRQSIPIFNQAFRFPFTKWSMATTWIFSLLFGYGLARCLYIFKKILLVRLFILTSIGIILAWFSIPLLSNNLFYPALRQAIPDDYFSLFTYLKTKPNGRIANLPQPIYWGWTYYRWGYTGSGFPWYGIQQPILDRAFDVWSEKSENYYWELSYALYKKDPVLFENVLDKYDINYILFDESVISPSHNRALIPLETVTLLGNLSPFSKTQQFGSLEVYERTSPLSQTYVQIKPHPIDIYPAYSWSDNDKAYLDHGTYISNDVPNTTSTYYPFRSLFTKRSIEERAFAVNEHFNTLTIESEQIPLEKFNQLNDTSLLERNPLFSKNNPNHTLQITIDKSFQRYDSSAKKDIQSENVLPCGDFNKGVYQSTNQVDTNGSWLNFTNNDAKSCLSFLAPDLPHTAGYLVSVRSRNNSGRPLQFSLINQTAKHTEIESTLPKSSEWTTTYFILPSLATDGRGYNIFISNVSVGDEKTNNDLSDVDFYEIPYDQMVAFNIDSNDQISQISNAQVLSVNHPNTSYYQAQVIKDNTKQTSLILTQSFHPGWKAYEIDCKSGILCSIQNGLPFVFGKALTNHVQINNWANGWDMPQSSTTTDNTTASTIVIFFLPQLLQWVGFLMLPLPFFFLLFSGNRHHQR